MNNKVEHYDDNSIMHFGKHRGQRLGDIKMGYFNWLWDQWSDDKTLKAKLTENSEDGKLARYIRSARNA
jgi:hypothetical protein